MALAPQVHKTANKGPSKAATVSKAFLVDTRPPNQTHQPERPAHRVLNRACRILELFHEQRDDGVDT